jgi:hypothetical protein
LVGDDFDSLRGGNLKENPYKYWQFQHSRPRLWTSYLRSGSNFECLGTPTKTKHNLSIHTVLVIVVTPDTYHGTRIVSTQNTNTGTVTDNEGGSAQYNGTSTSSTAVPYSFEYGKFTLTVETEAPDHSWTAHHRFEQNGIYNTMYGIPLGGRGHHPEQAVIEDAVKWIHGGGLSNPLQTAQ